MTTKEAIAFYGSQRALAEVLGIKQPSVSEWGEYPPAHRQLQLQLLTAGRLTADPNVIAPNGFPQS